MLNLNEIKTRTELIDSGFSGLAYMMPLELYTDDGTKMVHDCIVLPNYREAIRVGKQLDVPYIQVNWFSRGYIVFFEQFEFGTPMSEMIEKIQGMAEKLIDNDEFPDVAQMYIDVVNDMILELTVRNNDLHYRISNVIEADALDGNEPDDDSEFEEQDEPGLNINELDEYIMLDALEIVDVVTK